MRVREGGSRPAFCLPQQPSEPLRGGCWYRRWSRGGGSASGARWRRCVERPRPGWVPLPVLAAGVRTWSPPFPEPVFPSARVAEGQGWVRVRCSASGSFPERSVSPDGGQGWALLPSLLAREKETGEPILPVPTAVIGVRCRAAVHRASDGTWGDPLQRRTSPIGMPSGNISHPLPGKWHRDGFGN